MVLRLGGVLYAISLNGTFIYSIFVSIKWNTIWFVLGVIVFIESGICFVYALINYAHTEPNKPAVTGRYKYSRNPQQIFAVFMWVGVGLATTSYIILILCALQLILVYPTFIAQEEFCIKKYGNDYVEYMKRSPRYLWKI